MYRTFIISVVLGAMVCLLVTSGISSNMEDLDGGGSLKEGRQFRISSVLPFPQNVSGGLYEGYSFNAHTDDILAKKKKDVSRTVEACCALLRNNICFVGYSCHNCLPSFPRHLMVSVEETKAVTTR